MKIKLNKKNFLMFLIFSVGLFAASAANKNDDYGWIDIPVLNMIEYFNGNINYYLCVAIRLGKILCLLGIVWNCIQMIMGTLEGRKFLVGTISKLFLFFLCLTLYPRFSHGLRNFALNLGKGASGTSTQAITTLLADYMKEAEEIALANKEGREKALEENLKGAESMFRKLQEERDNMKGTHDQDTIIAIADIDDELASLTKKIDRLSKQASHIKKNDVGQTKTTRAIQSILVKDDKSQADSYRLDLSLKTSSDVDTGLISPNAMFRLISLSGEIMVEKEWTSVNEEWIDNTANANAFMKKIPIMNFPLRRIFDIVMVYITVLMMFVVGASCLIQYVMAIVEYSITSSFAIVLIPCFLFDGLKDIAQKILPTLLAQAVKLCFITMAMFFSCFTFLQLALDVTEQASNFDIKTFCYVLFTILLTFALCSNAPKWAVTLLSGQPQMSMGEFVSAAGAMVAGAAMAGRTGISAAKVGASGIRTGTNFVANRAGDIAAMGGAGKQARETAKNAGNGGLKSTFSGVGAGIKEGASRTGQRIQTGMSDFIHGGKNVGGKGSNPADITRSRGADKTNPSSQNAMNFSENIGTDGKRSSFKDYLKSQAAAGSNNQALRQGRNFNGKSSVGFENKNK